MRLLTTAFLLSGLFFGSASGDAARWKRIENDEAKESEINRK
ncbi:hypothetical protein [Candidatus Endomicrobiellum agilis]